MLLLRTEHKDALVGHVECSKCPMLYRTKMNIWLYALGTDFAAAPVHGFVHTMWVLVGFSVVAHPPTD